MSKLVPLGLKVTAEIKQRLDEAAKQSGRTQSQEAERRLWLCYAYEEAIAELRSKPR